MYNAYSSETFFFGVQGNLFAKPVFLNFLNFSNVFLKVILVLYYVVKQRLDQSSRFC